MHSASNIAAHKALSLPNIPRNPLKLILFFIQFLISCWQSYRFLQRYQPQRIISIGGYVSIPVCLVAKMLGISIDLYELNAVPGKATLFLARLATQVFVCFEQTKSYFSASYTQVVAYPIRFKNSQKHYCAELVRTQLGLSNLKKTIFVSGGSQGSLSINRLIKQWVELNAHTHSLIQIIHQTGTRDTQNWKEFYRIHEVPALIFDYRDDLAPCYQAADIIVCRAGAGSLFEALFFEKQSIVIPLEIKSTAHQKDNAYAIKELHPELFTVISEKEIMNDNTIFFSAINRNIHQSRRTALHSTEKGLVI
jgi:UDP-N-acetylglucosamine--N-acetylmuramyl-(pentapeptide) pyrophosphoryl-undecaprenol N-acetylglucosamine transferase